MIENKNGLLDENGNFKPVDNKYKYIYKRPTLEDIERIVKEFEDYYKETRLDNGGIKIESKVGDRKMVVIGGKGFADQLDEAFDKEIKKYAKEKRYR